MVYHWRWITGYVSGRIGDGSEGQANVTVLVLNDRAYRNIKQKQLWKWGAPRYIGVDFTDAHYAEVARGLGCDGERVTTVKPPDEHFMTGISA